MKIIKLVKWEKIIVTFIYFLSLGSSFPKKIMSQTKCFTSLSKPLSTLLSIVSVHPCPILTVSVYVGCRFYILVTPGQSIIFVHVIISHVMWLCYFSLCFNQFCLLFKAAWYLADCFLY